MKESILCLFRPDILLIVICFLGGIQVDAQKIDLEKELVARYLFNGNALNEVEDRNHGIENNVEYRSDRNGEANKCLYLSGQENYITIAHTEDLNWDARTESYSILFWVKSIDPRQGRKSAVRVLQKWDEIISTPYPFSFASGDTELHGAIRVGSSHLLCTIEEIWDDHWHHVAMIYRSDENLMSLYYDGQMLESKTLQFPSSTKNSLDICIGKTLRLEEYYKGYVDDLYFYNRAIDACEVETLYSGDLLNER